MPAYLIGIGGGSASGKSTLAAELGDRLPARRVHVINQDRSFWPTAQLPKHGSPDGSREWPDYNHPDSVNWPDLRARVSAARADDYDVVIVEGTLVLHDAELREWMDLMLFVEAAADERIVRRIRRNLAAGHSLDGICDYYLDSVRYRHDEFCEPTRAHADLVLPGGRYQRVEAEPILEEVVRRVTDGDAARRGPPPAARLPHGQGAAGAGEPA
jgi:uridine kinase